MTDPIAGTPSTYAYDGPVAWRAPVDAALRRVVDPEVAMNIVDVGLVVAVTATDQRIHVVMTMTSAACPVTEVIVGDVELELDRTVPAATEIDVELVWDPPWSTDRMSASAKAFMGW